MNKQVLVLVLASALLSLANGKAFAPGTNTGKNRDSDYFLWKIFFMRPVVNQRLGGRCDYEEVGA